MVLTLPAGEDAPGRPMTVSSVPVAAAPGLPRPADRHRLPGVTGLRAVAAVSVVVHHFGTALMPSWTRAYFRGGGYLVDVFFVLSGFLLGYAYTGPNGLSVARGRFVLGRMARLAPAYVVGLVLALPRFLELLPHGQPAVVAVKIAALFLLTMTMTQSWLPKAQSMNDPAWSLSDEAFFYLVMAFAAHALLRGGRGRQLAIAATLCGLSAVALNLAPPSEWIPRLPVLRVAPFLLAMFVGNWFQTAALPALGTVRATALQAVASAALVLTIAFPVRAGWDHLSASVVGLAAIVTLAAYGRGGMARVLDTHAMRLLGDASYGIYIYQVGVFWVATHYLRSTTLGRVTFAVTLAALVGFAIASVRLYEVPARHVLLRIGGYRFRPKPTADLPESGEDSSMAPPWHR